MRICIGGRNDIAVDVCKYLQTILPKEMIFAIPGRNDDGEDGYQRSFLKYVNKEGIQVVTLKDVYDWDDLIFLSLEFDRIIRPEKFASKNSSTSISLCFQHTRECSLPPFQSLMERNMVV